MKTETVDSLVGRPLRFPDFEACKKNDPTVFAGMAGGVSMERLVVALTNEKVDLIERILLLESIAPRRVRLPNGQVLIYRFLNEPPNAPFSGGGEDHDQHDRP